MGAVVPVNSSLFCMWHYQYHRLNQADEEVHTPYSVAIISPPDKPTTGLSLGYHQSCGDSVPHCLFIPSLQSCPTFYSSPHFTLFPEEGLHHKSAINKLSSPHHALNSLLFAPDGYPTATEDPVEIEETVRSGTIEGGDTRRGWERRN